MHFVNEQDDLAVRTGDFIQDRFQTFLELAAIFRACDQRAEIQRQQHLVLQAFRHVAIDDAQREALDDGGLADTGFADQHRVVFCAPRQNLNCAADFLVTANDRIELAVARSLCEIAGVFFQRIVGILRRR